MSAPITETASQRIIIVDDEERMCDSLTALLADDGYDVRGFRQAAEAAEAIRSGKVDLVVTDIRMPQMDGLELLGVVKEVDEEIPVILMTGYASLDSAIRAVSQGAYDYLMKPIEFTSLELAVKRALEKRRAVIDRRHLLERLKIATLLQERRINELNALYEAGKSIGSTANLHELLHQIVTLASTVTEAHVGSIMLLDEAGENLSIAAASGLEQEIIDRTVLAVGSSIAGYVARTGQPLRIDDVENDERFRRKNRERYGGASLLCAPLIIKNRVIGVINMANKEGGGSFTEYDLRLLVTFASQAAVAVDDANQFDKNRRRLIEFEILNQIATEMPQIQSMNEFRVILTERLNRVFAIDYSLWFNWDAESNQLELHAATGAPEIPLTDSGGIDLRAINRKQVRLSNMTFEPEDLRDVRRLSAKVKARLAEHETLPSPGEAFMAVPILRYGALAHIFCLGNHGTRRYSADDIALSQLVISQAALLFERERSLLNATRLLTMGNMISEISHDLRKPLNSIRGGVQIIRKRLPETEDSELFSMVDSEISRMNELVRELVDFSNPNKYQTEKVDLRDVVNRAAELVGPDLRKRRIDFSASFEPANWELMINKNQVVEAFLNMLINAVDAMPEGGKLVVLGCVEKPNHKQDNYLAIKISDTGCGISTENLPRVFDRYFTTKETGTGLGLAVVERIVSAHNGTLAVESVEGQGSTFTVYFPYGG